MRRRTIAVIMMLLLAVSVMAGCGKEKSQPVTAESLMKAVEENTKSSKSTDAHMKMNMVMEGDDIASIGLGDSLTMEMDADMKSTTEPVAVYMNGTMGMLGMNLDMEIYTVTEDSKLVTYVGMMNQWMRQETEIDTSQIGQLTAASEGLMENLESLALAENTEEVNGKEVYILSGTIEGEDIKNIMGPAESVFSAIGGGESITADTAFDGMTVDFKYAVGKEDNLPVYADYDFKGFENIANTEDIKMTISTFTMHIDYNDFNTVDAIVVPQEVIDSAQNMTEQQ